MTSFNRRAVRAIVPCAMALAVAQAFAATGGPQLPIIQPGQPAAGVAVCTVAGTLPSCGSNHISPGAMTINQSTQNAIINWQSFNVGTLSTVTFNQPSTNSITLNRITGGGGADTIEGTITANGRLFFVNPAGMMFSGTAHVNVGGLVATTMAITDTDFLAGAGGVNGTTNPTGIFHFTQAASTSNDVLIENDGTINITSGGAAALLGTAINTGTITAPRGTIVMANAQSVVFELQPTNVSSVTVSGPISLISNEGPAAAAVTNSGTLNASGGHIVMAVNMTDGGDIITGVSLTAGSTLRADTAADGTPGRIDVSAVGGSIIASDGGNLYARGLTAGQGGGSISITGDGFVLLEPGLVDDEYVPTGLNVSGTAGGGQLTVTSATDLSIGQYYARGSAHADGTVNGPGGSITFTAGGELQLQGDFTARGTGATTGGTISFRSGSTNSRYDAFTADASSPAGQPGSFMLAGPDLSIEHDSDGISSGSIGDDTISTILSGGTNVTLHALRSDTAETVGDLYIDNFVDIENTRNTHPVSLNLIADRSIYTDGNVTIASTSSPLSIFMQANPDGAYTEGGIGLYDTLITTAGGTISLASSRSSGDDALFNSGGSIDLENSSFDTRAGTGAGGSIDISGAAFRSNGVYLYNDVVHTGSGNITIFGIGNAGTGGGVYSDNEEGISQLITTTGSISITGVADVYHRGESAGETAFGLDLHGITIQSDSGPITLRGSSLTGVDGLVLGGLRVGSDAVVQTTSGTIDVAGSSIDNGVGLTILGEVNSGSGAMLLRASSNAGVKAIVLSGSIISDSVVNIRSGSVDAAGNVQELAATPINLGSTAVGNGTLDLSAADLGAVFAPELVIGSDEQSGAITVAGAITRTRNMTLQTGGDIAINAPITMRGVTLGLIGGGNVTQTATAPIVADTLVATGTTVTLNAAGNDVVTVSGQSFGGAGSFTYVDANAVTIGNGNVATINGEFDDELTRLVTGGIAGQNTLVRTLTGNLTLGADLESDFTNLVSAGVFLNPGNHAISTDGGFWHIYASTFTGEQRGGLNGNGPLPNIYDCVYAGACGGTISNNDQFVYQFQPTITVIIGNANREYGIANPGFLFTYAGVRYPDVGGNVLLGAPTTVATIGSNVGTYAIGGTFTSPAGYAITVSNGALRIDPATLTYVATPSMRTVGDPNVLTGTVTGYRNGDTQGTATTGTLVWTSPATTASPVGSYAINGSGLTAGNYVFVQAPGNTTALTVVAAVVIPPPPPPPPPPPVVGNTYAELIDRAANVPGATALGGVFYDVQRNPPQTYVYADNFAPVPICLATDPTVGRDLQGGDALAVEWSRVKSRPNLTNCVATDKSGGCSDF